MASLQFVHFVLPWPQEQKEQLLILDFVSNQFSKLFILEKLRQINATVYQMVWKFDHAVELVPWHLDQIWSQVYFLWNSTLLIYFSKSKVKCVFCSKKLVVCFISGTKSYKSTLDAKASASGALWGASFSASTDFKSVETMTKNASTFYTQSEASCCAYSASILEYNPPAFSQNFLSGIDGLPEVSSS